MIQIKQIWLILVFCLTPAVITAQSNETNYLEGAVPEVNNKVVFGKTLHLPGASKELVFREMFNWANNYYSGDTNRVTYNDVNKGVIVAMGNDTIVFKSSALSLDRAFINYQLELRISEGECDIQITKINFRYQEKERYSAEEMISDKAALNKAKTKIHRGYIKWRKGTIDFTNQILDDATIHLLGSKPIELTPVQQEIKQAKDQSSNKAMPVITNKEYKAEHVGKNIDNASIYTKLANKELTCYLQINNSGIKYNVTNEFSGLGTLFGKERVLLTVPVSEEYYESLDESEFFTLSFYEKDANNALITINCKRAIAQSIVPESIVNVDLRKELAKQPIHKLYINDIISVNINN